MVDFVVAVIDRYPDVPLYFIFRKLPEGLPEYDHVTYWEGSRTLEDGELFYVRVDYNNKSVIHVQYADGRFE